MESLTLEERLELQERVISILALEVLARHTSHTSPVYSVIVIKTALGQAMQELLDEQESNRPPKASSLEVQEILEDMRGALGKWAVEMRGKS